MTISIITPHLNYARFLKHAILNIREQVSDNVYIEHIVIDAGSTDESIPWLRDYTNSSNHAQGKIAEDGYSFKWLSEPDNGQTDAINKGLRMASGDLVCWLNADEFYLPGALKHVAKTFRDHPEADLVYGEPLFVDANNNPIRVKRDHRFDRKILLYYGCYISSCCTFWRRSLLEAGHFLDDTYRVTMDFEYWVRLAYHGFSFRFIPHVLAAFTWHPDNVSSVLAAKRREERLQVQFKYAPIHFSNKRLQVWWFDLMAKIYQQKRRFLIIRRKFSGDFLDPMPSQVVHPSLNAH